MFRIRRIYDDSLPINRDAIAQVQQILRSQFNGLPEEDINKLPDQLRDPLPIKSAKASDPRKGKITKRRIRAMEAVIFFMFNLLTILNSGNRSVCG